MLGNPNPMQSDQGMKTDEEDDEMDMTADGSRKRVLTNKWKILKCRYLHYSSSAITITVRSCRTEYIINHAF